MTGQWVSNGASALAREFAATETCAAEPTGGRPAGDVEVRY
jgi:hypothetical protein